MTTATEMEPKKDTSELSVRDGAILPLDADRCVSFFDKGHPYTFYFSRINQADWERYFSGISLSSHNEGRAQVTITDMDSAAIQLVEEKLVRVEGYRGEFQKREDWRQILPIRHTRPAAWLLRTVTASDVQSESFDPEQVEAVIDAAWGISKPGQMVLYTGLVHKFRPLTAEQKRRYCRATSETRVIGNGRNGRTVFVPKQPMLVKLYNDLIIGVEGYSIGGRKLETSEEAILQMDAYHKVIAVEQLFVGNNDANESAEEAA